MNYRHISYFSIILALTEMRSIIVIHWVLTQSLRMEKHLIHWVLVQSLGMEEQGWMKLLMLLSLNWWKQFLFGENLLENLEKA